MDIRLTDTAAGKLARFVDSIAVGTIPPDVEEKARCCLLYGLGIGLHAEGTPFAEVSARAAEALSGPVPGGATVLQTGSTRSVNAALLANAALLHGRCQEDTSGTAHLGVIVIPLMLALWETRGIPASRLLPALVAGYEVGGLLEAAFARQTVRAGFRASPLYGAFAATAAVCKLLDLSVEATRSALAHAAAFAGGTLQALGEGTDEWRYQVGVAAESGLIAAELARAGANGAQFAFEGPQGFVRGFAHTDLPETLCDRLGVDWSILRVTFKPYPVCAHNQSVVIGALHLQERVKADDIEALEIRIDPYLVPGLLYKGPFSRVSETLMSTAFCAAAALRRGRLDLAELEAFTDQPILDLMGRITVETDADIAFPACILRARLRDGSVVEQIEPLTPRDYDLTRPQIIAQLERMAQHNDVTQNQIRMLAECVDRLPEADPHDLIRAFRREAAPGG